MTEKRKDAFEQLKELPADAEAADNWHDAAPLPKLALAQTERLALLSEELNEAGVAIGKILRHGYFSHDPTNRAHGGNAEDLERELGDILWCMDLIFDSMDPISREGVKRFRAEAANKKPRYLHHQNLAK